MSFQENRFPILLGTTTAVIVGGLLYWGISSSGNYDTAKEDFDSAAGEIRKLTNAPAYPNSDNVAAKGKAVSEYRTAVGGLQQTFDKYRKTEIENVGVDDFGDALRSAREKFVEMFEAAETEVPPDSHLGLGVFTRETVDKQDTGVLLYQLGAFKVLFENLANARPTVLNNIYRPRLPEETGGTFDAEGKSFRAHPIEVTFTGREESLRQFLSGLDDSEEYYYVVRSIRIKNSRSTPPNANDARFEEPAAAAAATEPDDAFAGFEFPDDDETDEEEEGAEGEALDEGEALAAEPASSDSGQILKQVLGDELVEVFLRIDVIQFLEAKPLPKG